MVIDTSAVIAFLRNEPDAQRIEEILDAAPECRMSALNAFEARIVQMRRHGEVAVGELELLLSKAAVRIDPFDDDQALLAYEAYRRYGKGSGHVARLNLGDCAAYALATSRGLALLFVGEDFARTDVASVL